MFKHRRGRAWAALITCRHWWCVQCPLCPMSTYASQKERERSPDQCVLRLSRVLHRWINHWTRLSAYILTPCVVENQKAIVTGSRQPTHCYCPSFESTRRKNIGWEYCIVIDPSVEHSRKPKSTLIQASFLSFSTPIPGHSGHWMCHQCPHVIKATQALPLPCVNNNFA